MITDLHIERPLGRSPISLLIDDPSPGINPLHYFASTVNPDSTFYHYASKDGKWYFDSDKKFAHPIVEKVDPGFVEEFASWVRNTEVKGKISVVPWAAGLGRIDREIKGVPKNQVLSFIRAFSSIEPKLSISSELLTHTRALNLKTMKMMNISEHDWSQKQTFETLAPYIGLSLEILNNAGIDPSGVTSPCDFGMSVEGDYAKSVLEAVKRVKKHGLAWYFLHVDPESTDVPHRLMYLDKEAREAVVSIVASTNDPFWTSMIADRPEEEWIEEACESMLSPDGSKGRIADQVSAGSWITMITHWQSLYSNGTRVGFKGLKKLVSRINRTLSEKIVWMSCSEIASYIACTASAVPRILDGGSEVEISSPFNCSYLTLSFETRAKKVTCNGKTLVKTNRPLSSGNWSRRDERIWVSIPSLSKSKGDFVARLRIA